MANSVNLETRAFAWAFQTSIRGSIGAVNKLEAVVRCTTKAHGIFSRGLRINRRFFLSAVYGVAVNFQKSDLLSPRRA